MKELVKQLISRINAWKKWQRLTTGQVKST
jgi:hypothetical protein